MPGLSDSGNRELDGRAQKGRDDWDLIAKRTPRRRCSAATAKQRSTATSTAGCATRRNTRWSASSAITAGIVMCRAARQQARERGLLGPFLLHNTRTALCRCRPNVQMSVPSNLKMSVSPAFWWAVGGGIDDGAERERWRVAASRGVAGRRSWWAAGECCGAAFGAQRAPGVASVEGVSEGRRRGVDLEEARSAEQPPDSRFGTRRGAMGRVPELR